MQRTCVISGQTFEVTETELERLKAISPMFKGVRYDIPPPTHSPEERVRRRMAWRNDRTFYKRKCDLTGEQFVSMYPPDVKFPVFKQDAWHSDKWDPMRYGQDFDSNRPFFDQRGELRNKVPHWGVAISNCINSDYCNFCTDEKNCYLDIAAEMNEDCYYNLFTKFSKNCVDCTFVYNGTLCYECIQCYGCYGCKYSMELDDCSDCLFSFDCKGCRNCALSINLRNKQYCIMNKEYSKEEYEKKIQELKLDAYSPRKKVFELWKDMRIKNGIYRDMYNLSSENCTGNNIKNSKNCFNCYNATNCEDCAYLYDVLDAKNCQDQNYSLYNPELCFEVISTVGAGHTAFYTMGPNNKYCFYSKMCMSSRNCFGCIGVKQQEYCIFNKKYTKEQYEELVPKIIEHMRKTGEWGEFFPARLSPHGYNETVAQEYMPLTKEEVTKRGWNWREIQEEKLNVTRTIDAAKLPDAIADIPDDILNWAIVCEVSGKPFKITSQELKFYREQGIPVPHRHPQERHRDRNALRNPRHLWDRTCNKCGKAIQTSYAPDRPEKVYCESCYLKEVY